MAEETALVDEKKLTELCEKPNALVNSLPERSISGSRVTENTGAGCLIMGSSLQPSRGTSELLNAQKEPPKRDDSYPSSLRSTSTSCTSCSSYSLEISLSTTNNSDKESRPLPLKTPSESRDGQSHEAKPPSPMVCEKSVPSVTKSYRPSDPKPLQEQQKEQPTELKVRQCLDKHGSSEIVTPKSPSIESRLEKTFLSSSSDNGKVGAQPVSTNQLPKTTCTQDLGKHDSNSTRMKASQKEEGMFYAFVILHAQEDSDEAVRLKSRLESISSTIGATFSEDFAVPGQSTFRCVEDAIENSAFVMLLLTTNFNTRLNETSTDSALMNSIEKPHKYNTVIPLLPRANGLTRNEIPFILRTKNPLDESRDRNIFEKMVQKVLDSRTIQRQKLLWSTAQSVKKQRERQQWLLEERQYYSDIIRESTKVQELEEQVRQLHMQQQRLLPPFPGRPQPFGPMPAQNQSPMPSYNSGNMWQQPPHNIHIENAKYIMIGNNSTMTVGQGVDSGEEDDF